MGPPPPRALRVEVCPALPDGPVRVPLSLPEGATVRDALRQARGALPAAMPVDADRPVGVGVYGRLRGADWPLRDGDRVELYRPLTVDPKTARLRRAQARQRAAAPRREGGRGPLSSR